MNNIFSLITIAVFSFAAIFYQHAFAKEDTAQITLKKTAVSKQHLHKYTVKKGDVISSIIRRIPGITKEDIPDNYRIIKKLNPEIPDLNRLYVGQVLILPGRDPHSAEGSQVESVQAASVATDSSGSRTYTIKRGDNLTRIIYRELNVKSYAEAIKALRDVKSLNPQIANINKIYSGTTIKLPGKVSFASIAEEYKETILEKPDSAQTGEKDKLTAEKKIMAPETRLNVIKHIVSHMNGSVLSTGNYYLPIPKTGQVAIDCARIPVIEFDDQTTVFLDMENRLHDSLKKAIRENWKNFYVVNVDRKDDLITTLRKIIAATKAYGMTKMETPVVVGKQPPLEVIVDWLIVKADAKHTVPLLQGLRLVSAGTPLLPRAVRNYAQRNNLIITEIDLETGVVGKPDEIYFLPPPTVFSRTTAKDFLHGLVVYLGLDAVKDANIKVFDLEKDGFNLSIQADLLIKKPDRTIIVFSRSLPHQFINVLRASGYELAFVNDADLPKITLEKILRILAIPYAYGYFTFSGINKNSGPFAFSFAGTKIKTDKDHYVVEFAIDEGLRGLLVELWSAGVARY